MDTLDWLSAELQSLAGDNLVSLTHTRSKEPKDGSDTVRMSTLTIVLKDTSPENLEGLRETLREGLRKARISPFILQSAEVPTMLDTLPLKALMTRVYGDVLYGENPFCGLPVDLEHLRLRIEQEARNLLVRLRHDLVLSTDDGHLLRGGMWRTVRGVERVLEGITFLQQGEAAVPEDREKLWVTGAEAWELAPDRLNLLADFQDSADDLRETAKRVLPVLEKLVAYADKLTIPESDSPRR